MGQNMMNPALQIGASQPVDIFAFTLAIGAAGAIDDTGTFSTNRSMVGVTVVKTATKTGRYTVTLPRNYRHLLYKGASFTGVDDAALPTTTGLGVVFRDVDIGAGAQDGTIEVQLFRTDTNADAEAASGSLVSVVLMVTDRNSP